jgi:gluconate 5-dehydrogenase
MTTRVQDLFDLSGQVALVTGGSRGLGLQMAEALGEAGAKIMLSSRKAADLEEAVAHLQARGIDARWIAADASDEAQARGIVTQTMERLGRIDILVNNAGLGGNPPMMKTIAYNTSKGAAVNFTRALAGEWGAHGITVNAIAPGFFPSKMTQGLLATVGAEVMASHAPLNRLGDDEDLKGAVLLFASRAGKHITGQILAVDGGVSALVGG